MSNKTVKFLRGDRNLYEHFKIRQVIGTGNSIVYQVADEQHTIQCVKQIRFDEKQKEFIFMKEIQLLVKIKTNPHPNIVQYRGSYVLQEQKGNVNTVKKGYIQMEKGMANLKTYLTQRQTLFDTEDVLIFITTMIEVFAHLQKSDIAHRDIKPANILLFSEDPLYFKVCDVGAGTAVNFCDYTKQMTVIGTPYYLSPQLFRAYRQKMNLVNYKAFKSDTYSLGLLFLQFCSLKKMEERLNKEGERIQMAIDEIKQNYPNIIGLGKVLRRMLDQDITARMDFIELEKFISENNLLRNKINKTVTLDPQMYQQISSQSLIVIDKMEDLAQIENIVSTQNKFEKLCIDIKPVMGRKGNNDEELLEQLANIKHMKLSQLKLSLEMCNLTEKHVQMLTDALLKNKDMRILSLNLWNNHISENSLKRLMNVISSHLLDLCTLELNLASNQIRIDHSMQECFHLGSLQALRRLEVNLSFNEVQPSALAGVLKNIAKAPELTHLVLQLQSIRTNPVHLAMALKELVLLKFVSVLDLNISCNSIRQQGIYALGDMCAAMSALKTCRCILRNAQITDKGFNEFLKAMGKLQQLRELKINLMNNQITEKAMKMGPLQSHSNLQMLDLNFSNNKLSDFAFKNLCNSVSLVKNIKIIRLVFDTCSLTEKGCLYLGRLISQQPNLQEIDLSIRENDVKFDGIQYICAGLIQIKKVKRLKLNLEGTLIGDYSASYLATCLLKLRNLSFVDLNLQNCDLTSETMGNIVKAVRECCRKTEEISIDMRRNRQIKKELLQQLRSQMQNRKVAIKVDQMAQQSATESASSFVTA